MFNGFLNNKKYTQLNKETDIISLLINLVPDKTHQRPKSCPPELQLQSDTIIGRFNGIAYKI